MSHPKNSLDGRKRPWRRNSPLTPHRFNKDFARSTTPLLHYSNTPSPLYSLRASSPLAVILPRPSMLSTPAYSSPCTSSSASKSPHAWAKSLGATPPHPLQIVLRLILVC